LSFSARLKEAAEKRLFCALRACLRHGRKRIRGSPQASSLTGLWSFLAATQRWKRWAIIRRPCRGWVEP